MTPLPPNETGRKHTETQLIRSGLGFSASYLAVQYLTAHIADFPETITGRTIEALATVLESDRFSGKKQVLFLYGEAADAMTAIARHPQNQVSGSILPRLHALLSASSGKRLRAVGQALGRLPVQLRGPEGKELPAQAPLPIEFPDLVSRFVTTGEPTLSWKGRSLLILDGHRPCGVIKFANSRGNVAELVREAGWLDYFNINTISADDPFRVPAPVKRDGRVLFQLTPPLPSDGPEGIYKGLCIAFVPCDGYFDYPNEQPRKWPVDRIKNIFFKNARLLGALTARGMIHTALIPLFHNRVQQGRRNDNGAYLWEHGGRLDQWLDSCRYPNFAASGLRDFEHLIRVKDSRELRHYIGEHLLSFILVAGSYFRNHDPGRRGKDNNQSPRDTRDLFCPALFNELLLGISRSYFSGLVDRPFPPGLTSELIRRTRGLTGDLVAAMGVDDNMEERLRVRDQERMSSSDFRDFLTKRGVTDIPAKGERDITLETGPHLGGFNQPISVPGLIDYLFWFSALCVSHCFIKENKLKA
ncbi:MAG: SidJ-related pseudokinase [Desulfobacterales bacterium]|nr:SidJ-related pseudokinase [Desulfobacterales bacterium]